MQTTTTLDTPRARALAYVALDAARQAKYGAEVSDDAADDALKAARQARPDGAASLAAQAAREIMMNGILLMAQFQFVVRFSGKQAQAHL